MRPVLSPSRDETMAGGGCQPGDLTKRMAIPWQADFFDCSVQDVNFTTPHTNKTISNASIAFPLAPTFLPIGGPRIALYNVYDGASRPPIRYWTVTRLSAITTSARCSARTCCTTAA